MPRPGQVVALLVAAIATTSCATGERPYFSDSPSAPGEATGDAAIDEVLSLIDRAGDARFSAEYTIVTRFGGRETEAEVVQLTRDERVVTIGNVEFRVDGGRTETCRAGSRRCSEGIDNQRVSDIQVTDGFYAEEAAVRLRVDAANAQRRSEASTADIAGQRATCATLTVSGGTIEYCALDSGVLARLDDADVVIELTGYGTEPTDTSLRSD